MISALPRLLRFVFKVAAGLVLASSPAGAHSPHDHIELFALSPNFENDGAMLIVVRQHLFRSTDGGRSWKRIVNGLDVRSDYLSLGATRTRSGAVMFYAGTEKDGLFQSADLGTSWKSVDGGFGTGKIAALQGGGSSILVFGGKGDWFRSEAGDGDWEKVAQGRDEVGATTSDFADGEKSAKFVVAEANGALRFSADAGKTWADLPKPGEAEKITALALGILPNGGEHLFVGTGGEGIFRTDDGGESYQRVNRGLSEKSVVGLTVSPHYATDGCVFTTTWHKGVFRSADRGLTWKLGRKNLTKHVQADTRKVPHFYTIRLPRNFDGQQPVFLGAYDGLFESADGGASWTQRDTLGLGVLIDLAISPNFASDSTLAFTTYWHGAILSRDAGQTWTPMHAQTLANHQDRRKIIRVHSVYFSPNYAQDQVIWVGIRNEWLKTTDHGKSWASVDLMDLAGNDDVIVDRVVFSPEFTNDGVLYMGGRTGIAKTRRGAIFKSTDCGETFELVLDLDEMYLHSLLISPGYPDDGTLFASGGDGGCNVYKTTDGGRTWQKRTAGIAFMRDEGIELAMSPNFVADGVLFAGTGKGLFQSADRGENWVPLPIAEAGDEPYVETIAVSPEFAADQTLIVGVRGRGNFISNDAGAGFRPLAPQLIGQNHGMTKMWYYSPGRLIQFSPNFAEDRTLFGFTGEDLFRSRDGGENWEKLDLSGYPAKLSYLAASPAFDWRLIFGIGALLAVVAVFVVRKRSTARSAG